MLKVYVAGPYTKGNVEQNVLNAIDASSELISIGLAPFCPHLSHYVDQIHPHSWKQWMDIDIEFLIDCDIVLRIPGESKGADFEVNEAHKLGMLVVYSIDEIKAIFKLPESK
jgi:hypothetical protein